MIVKAGLLTTILSHVLNSTEKEFVGKIFIIRASRKFKKETPQSKQILPYLRYRESFERELALTKESETIIPMSEWKRIIEEIKQKGFQELTVSKLGFLIENTTLKKTIEDSIGKKITQTKFVLIFEGNTQSAKEDYIKRDLLEIMKIYVDKLDLKYSTLELTGIYTLQDWRTERKYNLLSTEKINLEKDVVRDIVCSLFKPSIILSGQEHKIRFMKWYTMSEGKMLKLAGYEKV